MAPGMQPSPIIEAEMSLIDLMADVAISECRFCDTCGQKVDKKNEDEVKQLNEMINFEKDGIYITNRNLKDFNEFFKSTRENQSLLQIFTPEQIANTKQIEKDTTFENDILSTSVPNYLSIPLAPTRRKRPIVDLLTGLELGLTLPKTETLKPSKYVPQPPVGILIEIEDVNIEDERKPIPRDEVEEILRFLYPDLDIPTLRPTPPPTPEPIEEPENRQSADSEFVVKLSRKQRKSKKKRDAEKRKIQAKIITTEAAVPVAKPAESIIQIAEPAIKPAEPIVKIAEPIVEIAEPVVKPIEPIVEVITPPPECQIEPQLTASMIPHRKDLSKAGEVGTKIQIYVNMVALNFSKKFTQQKIEHYGVHFDPNKPKCLTEKAYAVAKAQLFPKLNPAYNDGTIISVGCLPIESPTVVTVNLIDDNNEKVEVKVRIEKKCTNIDLNWMLDVQNEWKKETKCFRAVTTLQKILNSVAMEQSIRAKRYYYVPPDNEPINLGGGFEMWYGLFQSVHIGWKPFLKVDVKHRAFFWGISVIDYLKFIFDKPPKNLTFEFLKKYWNYIHERLVNLRVTISFNGAQRSQQLVLGLVDKRPHDTIFPGIDGKMISVREFFLVVKGYVIQYPDLPCLKIASQGNDLYIPMEFCTVDSEQPMKSLKINKSQTEILYKAAMTDSKERRRKIFYVLNAVNKEDDECLKNFGVSVNREFEKVNARILEPPILYCDLLGQVRIKPENGKWDIEKFQYPTTRLKDKYSWTVLNMSNMKMITISAFEKMIANVALKLSIEINEPLKQFDNLSVNMSPDYIANYLQVLKNYKVQLVIVVLPDNCKNFYCTIKQLAELYVGILIHCVKASAIECITYNEVKEILMKVNAKLGGINYSFMCEISRPDYLGKDSIILGADVTHPPNRTKPSISALVASQDPYSHFQYNAELRFQPPFVEIMYDLESMMIEQLCSYYRKTGGIKPKKIIYYRDGVGEDDFAKVMNIELLAIRRACNEIEKGYNPKIVFVIVQKQINTRFFPLSNDEAGDENFNVKIGTIVDTVITHPTDIDFILLSHRIGRGTAVPTKYRCLWNDDDAMTQDELEQLTYYLCHMFVQSNQSVKYPAPTYYAHIAAARGRVLTQGMSINLEDLPKEQVKLQVHLDLVNESPMYYL